MEREPHGVEKSERFRLVKDATLLTKGRVFEFYPDSGVIYMDGEPKYPLRPGLIGYLWLLRTETGYFRRAKEDG